MSSSIGSPKLRGTKLELWQTLTLPSVYFVIGVCSADRAGRRIVEALEQLPGGGLIAAPFYRGETEACRG